MKKMPIQKLILLISIVTCHDLLAIPIVNENVANSGMLTVYPDSHDPHRYYIAPNVVMIARDRNDRPYFSYNEYRKSLFTIEGVMQMTLVPAYTREDLEMVKAGILKKDPQAEFSGVPFIQSSLSLTGELPELINHNQCNHTGGLIGQEQSCALVLTSKGRALFHRALSQRLLFTTLQFSYSIAAVARTADGKFVDQVINHGIAVRIDGEQLADHPELIQRY